MPPVPRKGEPGSTPRVNGLSEPVRMRHAGAGRRRCAPRPCHPHHPSKGQGDAPCALGPASGPFLPVKAKLRRGATAGWPTGRIGLHLRPGVHGSSDQRRARTGRGHRTGSGRRQLVASVANVVTLQLQEEDLDAARLPHAPYIPDVYGDHIPWIVGRRVGSLRGPFPESARSWSGDPDPLPKPRPTFGQGLERPLAHQARVIQLRFDPVRLPHPNVADDPLERLPVRKGRRSADP
jgi:hypothetical protein